MGNGSSNTSPTEIYVSWVGPSSCMPEDSTGIDACVQVRSVDVEVTLVPSYDGERWTSWGEISHWLSDPNLVPRALLDDIEAAVDEAAKREGMYP